MVPAQPEHAVNTAETEVPSHIFVVFGVLANVPATGCGLTTQETVVVALVLQPDPVAVLYV